MSIVTWARHSWIAGLVIALAVCAHPSRHLSPVDGVAGEDRGPGRLNVIFILADDQGCGDFGFSGNPRVKTPHIDKLVREGTLFTSFHVSPVCSPTRASLLTGRHHQRTGVFGVVTGNEYMAADEVTVAELLQAEGYRTALVGKWHLGENYPLVPHAQGFDEFFGFRDGSSGYFNPVMERNGKEETTKGYLTDILTDEAIAFVERNAHTPFFLYLPYNAPHSPLEVPESFLAGRDSEPAQTAKLYGMVESMDENIGRLLARVAELGLDEKTLVIFTSDNGGLPVKSEPQRPNCGLAGWKYDVLEGGVRVPLVMRLPGHVPAKAEVHVNTAHIDMLPTIVDFAGVQLPRALPVDGRSLRPLLQGDEGTAFAARKLFMHYPGETPVDPMAAFPGGSILSGSTKLVQNKDKLQLFDLTGDPGEKADLAKGNAVTVAQLEGEFVAWWSAVRGARSPKPPIPVGYVEENPTYLRAHPAKLTNLAFQYSEDPPLYRSLGVHRDWIARWTTVDGKATWRVDVKDDTRLRLGLELRCASRSNGSKVRIRLGGASTEGVLSGCTSTGKEWHVEPFGELEAKQGISELTVEAVSLTGESLMELRRVQVERVP